MSEFDTASNETPIGDAAAAAVYDDSGAIIPAPERTDVDTEPADAVEVTPPVECAVFVAETEPLAVLDEAEFVAETEPLPVLDQAEFVATTGPAIEPETDKSTADDESATHE